MIKVSYLSFGSMSVTIASLLGGSCVGGAGWDDSRNVETAKRYPPIESRRIQIKTEPMPYQSFSQHFEDVFVDFELHGDRIGDAGAKSRRTWITGTRYSVAYDNFVLTVFRDESVIAEKTLPSVFYMHPMSSAAIVGPEPSQDTILCRTYSRATTGLHYVLIVDGNGDVLFEKVLGAAEDWDILPGRAGEIIIGGARSKIVLTRTNG